MSVFIEKNTKQAKWLRFYVQNQWLYANFCPVIEGQYLWSCDWRV